MVKRLANMNQDLCVSSLSLSVSLSNIHNHSHIQILEYTYKYTHIDILRHVDTHRCTHVFMHTYRRHTHRLTYTHMCTHAHISVLLGRCLCFATLKENMTVVLLIHLNV